MNKTHFVADEKLIYRTKPHWIIYARGIGWFFVGLLLWIFGSGINLDEHMFGLPFYALAAYIIMLIGVYYVVSAFIIHISSQFIITNQRVIMKTGLLETQSFDIPLEKIESIHETQTVPGRVFNFGTVVICGVGGSKDIFRNIPFPKKFRQKIQNQADISFSE